jgi:hypothetical protein
VDLGWNPIWSASDSTYRFSLANINARKPLDNALFFGGSSARFSSPLPVRIEVEPVNPSSATYWAPSPIDAVIAPIGPFASATHRLVAHLREVEAYPTRLFRPPAGETCVRGVVVDGAGVPRGGVEIAIHDPSAAPWLFIRTDTEGRFLFRLPRLPRPSPAPAEPGLQVTAPGFAVNVTPHPAPSPDQALFAFGRVADVIVEAV